MRTTQYFGLLAACLLIFVSGCSDSKDAAQHAESSTSTAQEWNPRIAVTTPTFTDADRESYRRERLANLAQQKGISSPPSVDLVRWTTNAEFDAEVAKCLTEQGFAASAGITGGVTYTSPVPASQEAQSNLAWYICEAKFTPDIVYAQPWSSDQLRILYRYWNEVYIPCMESHGTPVSVPNMPSEENYISSFESGQAWWPQEAQFLTNESKANTIQKACPYYPPDELFYGTAG